MAKRQRKTKSPAATAPPSTSAHASRIRKRRAAAPAISTPPEAPAALAEMKPVAPPREFPAVGALDHSIVAEIDSLSAKVDAALAGGDGRYAVRRAHRLLKEARKSLCACASPGAGAGEPA